MRALAFATALALLLAMPAGSATLTGKVVRVVDGDTLVVEAAGQRHRIRMAGIDAPERNQPWGEAATRELRRALAGEHIAVEWYKKDRWKPLIGVILLDNEDVNLRLVDRGLAWHYKRYADDQTPEQREAYGAAETAARGARRGLWSDPNPMAPWDWRRR